jgi:hypothetical protein
MPIIRRALLAVLAVTAALVVSAPAAGASTWSVPSWLQGSLAGGVTLPVGGGPVSAGACTTATQEGQGRTGGTATDVCSGAGLVFIGPSIGQIATVIGPTIMSPAFVGQSIVSAGNVAVGP